MMLKNATEAIGGGLDKVAASPIWPQLHVLGLQLLTWAGVFAVVAIGAKAAYEGNFKS